MAVPKVNPQRRNRHTSAGTYGEPQAPRPFPKDIVNPHPRARRDWRTLTAAPFTVLWLPTDWDLAHRLIRLRNRLEHLLDDPSSSAAHQRVCLSEIARLETVLGVDPRARAFLRWQYVPERGRGMASVSRIGAAGLRLDDLPEVPDGR